MSDQKNKNHSTLLYSNNFSEIFEVYQCYESGNIYSYSGHVF